VITEDGANLNPIVFNSPDFSTTASDAELIVVHAAPALSGTDVYLTAPGADLSAANPIASLSFRQTSNPQTAAVGDYQLSITAAGDPLNVLFSSSTLTLAAGASNLLVITDDAGEGTGTISVVRTSSTTEVLADVNAPTNIRVINAAGDTLARDVAIDDDFANLLFAAVPFAAPTDFVPVPSGGRKFTITPAGNAGVLELEYTSTLATGRIYTVLIASGTSALTAQTFTEDRRRVNDQSTVRLLNGSTQALEFFILEVGTSIEGVQPFQLLAGEASQAFVVRPSDRELTLRIPGTQTIALGPVPITLDDAGIHSILAVNGATPETSEVVLFDDFD
jgi:hypothetical protein